MSIIERAKRLRAVIEQTVENLTDNAALEVPELFPVWEPGAEYVAGQRVRYDGILYKVLTAHASQAEWLPGVAHSLFAPVLIPDDNTIPEWVQPDSTNTYKAGDKVKHNGKTWKSDVDNNVWEPGVYGWSVV